jgi:hypothetical protein
MNPDLIPSYDLLGSPAPPWLAQVLMALTLSLHWLLLGGVVGGAVVLLLNAARGKGDPARRQMNRGLAPFLPFLLSMAMTVGIAPLLFVQVLYGQFFYTSNILMGFWWLGLLVVVTGVFALLWTAWHRVRQGRPLGIAVPVAVLVLAVLAAKILSSNATLMQSPEAWEAFRAQGMNRPYFGDSTFVPRLLFALSGFVAGGGLLVAVLSRAGLLYGQEAGVAGADIGLRVALPALAAQLIFGVVLLLSLPSAQRSAVLGGGAESLFAYAAIAGFLAAVVLALKARGAGGLRPVLLPAVAFYLGLFGTAFARDTARRAALAPAFKLSSVPQHPEWSSFALFLVFFLGALGVITYLVKLSLRPKAA